MLYNYFSMLYIKVLDIQICEIILEYGEEENKIRKKMRFVFYFFNYIIITDSLFYQFN